MVKQYASASSYESKLKRVMERILCLKNFNILNKSYIYVVKKGGAKESDYIS